MHTRVVHSVILNPVYTQSLLRELFKLQLNQFGLISEPTYTSDIRAVQIGIDEYKESAEKKTATESRKKSMKVFIDLDTAKIAEMFEKHQEFTLFLKRFLETDIEEPEVEKDLLGDSPTVIKYLISEHYISVAISYTVNLIPEKTVVYNFL